MGKTKVKTGKILSHMVRTVLRRNRIQEAALCITYVLTFALLVPLSFFYPSVEKTFDRFLEEYGMPEATILSGPLPQSLAEKALEETGVRASSLRFVLEAQTHFPNGKTISCRYCGVPESDGIHYFDVEEKEEVRPGDDRVMLSAYFARHNGIKPGDSFTLTVNGSEKELTVTNLVSTPETICTNRDEFSWYDSNDYKNEPLQHGPQRETILAGGSLRDRLSELDLSVYLRRHVEAGKQPLPLYGSIPLRCCPALRQRIRLGGDRLAAGCEAG